MSLATTTKTTLLALALCIAAVSSASADDLVFWNGSSVYSTSGTDTLYMGQFPWPDGNRYVGVYDARDPNNCVAYFAINGGSLMIDGLNDHAAVKLGDGNDYFQAVTSSYSRIGGSDGSRCRNLPRLYPLSDQGYSLQVWGEGGADHVFGTSGSHVLLGGPGDDTLNGGRGYGYLAGESGSDLLMTGSNDGAYTNAGSGPDLIWSFAGSETHTSGSGSDCVLDENGARSVDCGTDTDGYIFGNNRPATVRSCEYQETFDRCSLWVQ